MTHRSVNATVLALALVLGGTSPAFALTRQFAFEWAPATGPVAGYAVYASVDGSVEELVATVTATGTLLAVESSAFVTVSVAAYDSAGHLGPRSDASEPVRLCPGDFDGDEVTGLRDWGPAQSCFGKPADGFCGGADINGDGRVGLSDLQQLSFGAQVCPPVGCAGDFDGDQLIGASDYARAQACYGQAPHGACAPADLDGDGAVTLRDIGLIANSIGSDACAL